MSNFSMQAQINAARVSTYLQHQEILDAGAVKWGMSKCQYATWPAGKQIKV